MLSDRGLGFEPSVCHLLLAAPAFLLNKTIGMARHVGRVTSIHSIAQWPCTGGRPWPPPHSYPTTASFDVVNLTFLSALIRVLDVSAVPVYLGGRPSSMNAGDAVIAKPMIDPQKVDKNRKK